MAVDPNDPTNARRLLAATRRARAFELRLEHYSIVEIAEDLGVSKQAVAKMLRRELGRLQELTEGDADKLRELEARRLDKLIRSRWDAAVTGDDASFDRVLRAMDQRQDLLGLKRKPGADDGGSGEPINITFNLVDDSGPGE